MARAVVSWGRRNRPESDAEVCSAMATGPTLSASGDLDRTGAGLIVALAEHQLAVGCRQVRVELAGLTSIDAAALSALDAAKDELNGRGCRLLLAGVPEVGVG